MAWAWLLAAMLVTGAMLITGCGASGREPMRLPPQPAPTLPAAPSFVTAPPEEALPALIEAERQAAHERNLALLQTLWAEDARVIDRRGTPQTDDDYRWPNRAAVLDRYVLAVFPNPPPIEPVVPESLTVDGDTAHLHAGVDDWTFVYRDGRWWILELAYN